jgi:hypothetical protein
MMEAFRFGRMAKFLYTIELEFLDEFIKENSHSG